MVQFAEGIGKRPEEQIIKGISSHRIVLFLESLAEKGLEKAARANSPIRFIPPHERHGLQFPFFAGILGISNIATPFFGEFFCA